MERYFLDAAGVPVAEHCNLNCRGCLHFCHQGQRPYYYMLENYIRDIRQLHKYFYNIDTFRIYGGEPLLNPELSGFIEATHKEFPHSQINLLTNGILLTSMSDLLIACLRENKVNICWSVYPVMNRRQVEKISAFLEKQQLQYESNEIFEFYTCFNPRGDTDKEDAFRKCSGKFCHVLRDGKISSCPAPMINQYINSFGVQLDFSDGMLDLYGGISTEEILSFLKTPHTACRYCTAPRTFKWEQQNNDATLTDWEA